MNILFLADIHPKSHNLKWIIHLTKRYRLKSYIICNKDQFANAEQSHLDFLLQSGIKVLPPVNDYSTINFIRTFIDSQKLKQLISTYGIDIVHVMYAEPSALWALHKKSLKCQFILTTRGTDILFTIPSFFARKDILGMIISRKYKKAFNAFSAITCTSANQKEVFDRNGVKKPVLLVRTGVDWERISKSELDMKARLKIDKEIILMPRSMYPLYNHEFTLDAISAMDSQLADRFTFVFVNSDTKDRQYMEEIKSKASKIPFDIRFYPTFSPEEIYSLYKQSRLVVMNPKSDGSAVSAMEAMACGTPVILPPLSYDKDIFGEFVFQLQSWESADLKEMIESVLKIPKEEMAEKMTKTKSHINKGFTTDRQMELMHAVYEKVLNNEEIKV